MTASTSATARPQLPLVYSCSGCSSVAQLANHLALRLDRDGAAEMSCIAGVGGNVRSLVRRAREAAAIGRAIVAIDGCILACSRSCLAERGVAVSRHVLLADVGVAKKYHTDFDPAQAAAIYPLLLEQVQALSTAGEPASGSARESGQEAPGILAEGD